MAGKTTLQPSDSPKPRLLTEDKADTLFCERRKRKQRTPLREAIREFGDDDILDG